MIACLGVITNQNVKSTTTNTELSHVKGKIIKTRKREPMVGFNGKFKFCPNCGADMRGGQDGD